MTRCCIYAFDLDGTLLQGNSSWKFYRYALLHRLFPYKSVPKCVARFLGFKFFFFRFTLSLYSNCKSSVCQCFSGQFVQLC